MDRAAKFDVLSMKRGIFMDERGFGTRLSMKRCVFMDERGFWTELSMKIGLFVDKGTELMRLSMKLGGFMEREQGAKKGGGWRLAGKMLRRGKGRGMWV